MPASRAKKAQVQVPVNCPLCGRLISCQHDLGIHIERQHTKKYIPRVNGRINDYSVIANENVHVLDKRENHAEKIPSQVPQNPPTIQSVKEFKFVISTPPVAASKKRKRYTDQPIAQQSKPATTAPPIKKQRVVELVAERNDSSEGIPSQISSSSQGIYPVPSSIPALFASTQPEYKPAHPIPSVDGSSYCNCNYCRPNLAAYPPLASYPPSYPATSNVPTPSRDELASRSRQNPIIPASIRAQSMGNAHVEPMLPSQPQRRRGREFIPSAPPVPVRDEFGCHRHDGQNHNARFAPYVPSQRSLSHYAFAPPQGIHNTGANVQPYMSSYPPQSYSSYSNTPIHSSAPTSSSSGSYPSSNYPSSTHQPTAYDTSIQPTQALFPNYNLDHNTQSSSHAPHYPSTLASSGTNPYPSYQYPFSTHHRPLNNVSLPCQTSRYDYGLDYIDETPVNPIVQRASVYQGLAPRMVPSPVIPINNFLGYSNPQTQDTEVNAAITPVLSPVLPELLSSPQRVMEPLLPALDPLVPSTPKLESESGPNPALPAHDFLRYSSPATPNREVNDTIIPVLSPILPELSTYPQRTEEPLFPTLKPLVPSTSKLESESTPKLVSTPECGSTPASVSNPLSTTALDDCKGLFDNAPTEGDMFDIFYNVNAVGQWDWDTEFWNILNGGSLDFNLPL
ncbi:hypothetical protein BDN70DRAFT_898742 [Pholiota conissans]|uniref:C2H2-type domain-containing protein n=1 Tax=Pholiota conissans TaxID=109636 RepID=A0A9P5YU10_9AGAR|nr:hypothetical protein BDN70DRAFT_898742 [Pholiota conissans]